MKSAKTPQPIFVVIPGAEKWALWKWVDSEGQCIAQAESPSALSPPHEATICLPANETATAAIWLTTSDETMIVEMGSLQAEALFSHEKGGSVKAFQSIRHEDSRILIFALIAPAEPRCLEGISFAARCVPAVTAFAFMPDALTVFRELDTIVAVLTTDEHPVGILQLGARTLDVSAAGELLCLIMRLSAEGIARNTSTVIVWSEPTEPGFSECLEKVGISCQKGERGSPRIPVSDIDLSPTRFIRAKRREQWMRKIRLGGLASLVVVSLITLAWFVGYAWIEFEYHRLESDNASLHPEATDLKAAADRWFALEPAINPRQFALEHLFQFASRLPEKGVRLTLFRMDAKGFLVTGEADKPAQVIEYQGGLAAAPELAALKLTMPPPKIMQDNIARFEILAARKGATHEASK